MLICSYGRHEKNNHYHCDIFTVTREIIFKICDNVNLHKNVDIQFSVTQLFSGITFIRFIAKGLKTQIILKSLGAISGYIIKTKFVHAVIASYYSN